MSLPVSPDYLAYALKKKCRVGSLALSHHSVGDLILPTGKLVASDPVAYPETEPFSRPLPKGVFPVVLSVARISTDQRVAFATIRFRESLPAKWQVLTVGDDKTDDSLFSEVDSGVAGFIDCSAAKAMIAQMRKDEATFNENMDAAMQKTAVDTWSWLNVPFGKGNLIAFSPGCGDGEYVTYVGFDAAGEASVVVTDFGIASDEKDAD